MRFEFKRNQNFLINLKNAFCNSKKNIIALILAGPLALHFKDDL
jgi:hypothetical protein